MKPYRLSVLDQSPISEGDTTADTLRKTIDLAQRCEAFGYDRFWMAEHHGSTMAGVAPEVLIGPIALATQRIRVGSGGIMLPHHSPFKVAENFGTLAALAPGRIDLGVGRAAGSDQRAAFALQRDRSKRITPDDFPQNLAELIGYLSDDGLPAEHPFAPLHATMPDGRGGSPDIWLLGSSMDSALWAAEAGLPYCFADFINSRGAEMAFQYRRRFKPSARLAEPHVMAAVWTIAAPEGEDAARLELPSRVMFAHLFRGQTIKMPSVEKAEAWLVDNPTPPRDRRTVTGSPREVWVQLDKAAAEYEADELMLINVMHDHATRVRSYELIAAEYGLATQAEAA